MTGQAIRTRQELMQQHAAHAANIRLLQNATPRDAAAAARREKTVRNLSSQMLAIDTQLMRNECAEGA
jgi:hypothetical protein